jgi:hypothetical protein
LKSTPDFNRGVVFRQQLFALSRSIPVPRSSSSSGEIINLGNNLFVAICCYWAQPFSDSVANVRSLVAGIDPLLTRP